MHDLFMEIWPGVGKWLVDNRLAAENRIVAVLQFRSRHLLRTTLHEWMSYQRRWGRWGRDPDSDPEMPRMVWSSSEEEFGQHLHAIPEGSSDDS